jgi:pimeloyl-ACP methyl ester carboxylesterase
MKEIFFDTGDGKIFYRSLEAESKPPILMIHGIGESGICFADAVDYLENCNLIIPDLPGFGRSEPSIKKDYSIETQITKLWTMIDALNLKDINLIGHSYGGILTTLMCKHDEKGRIKNYINIEGPIAASNIIISNRAKAAHEDIDTNFTDWLFHGEFKKFILEKLGFSSAIRYFESVRVCDPDAFAQSAVEICKVAAPINDNNVNQIGFNYRELGKLPRVYCWGTKSGTMKDAVDFLEENDLDHKSFAGTHWLMLEERKEFYEFVKEFIGASGNS